MDGGWAAGLDSDHLDVMVRLRANNYRPGNYQLGVSRPVIMPIYNPELLVTSADSALARLIQQGRLSLPPPAAERVSGAVLPSPKSHLQFIRKLKMESARREKAKELELAKVKQREDQLRSKMEENEEKARKENQEARREQVLKRLKQQEERKEQRKSARTTTGRPQGQPLFKKIEQEYEQLKARRAKQAQRVLDELRQAKKSLGLAEIEEHRQRYEQIMKRPGRKSQDGDEKYEPSFKGAMYQQVQAEQSRREAEREKEREAMQLRQDKLREFLQSLRCNFRPMRNERKRRELQLLGARTQPRERGSPRLVGLEYLKMLKQRAVSEQQIESKSRSTIGSQRSRQSAISLQTEKKGDATAPRDCGQLVDQLLSREDVPAREKRRLVEQQAAVLREQARVKGAEIGPVLQRLSAIIEQLNQ